VERHKRRVAFETKMEAVKTYLTGKQPLRAVAARFGIPYKTLWNWVRLFKAGGAESLEQKKTGKPRIAKELETEIMLLKEQNPALTIRAARKALKKKGHTASNRTVWQTWRKHGLAKRSIHKPIHPFCEPTPELSAIVNRAEIYAKKGNTEEAAKILNSMSCLPDITEISFILKLPEKSLSLRRQLDRLYLQYTRIPLPEFKKKAREIGKKFEHNGYIYSSIVTDFLELTALSWIGKPREKIVVLKRLAKKMRNMKENPLWFLFYFHEALAYVTLLQIDKAFVAADKCRRLAHALHSSFCYLEYANLLTMLSRFKDAHFYYRKALKNIDDQEVKNRIILTIATIGYDIAGKYQKCKKYLNRAKAFKDRAGFGSAYNTSCASVCFAQGDFASATDYYLKSLRTTTTGQLFNQLYRSSTGLAAVAMALNQKAKARMYIAKCMPVMKKNQQLMETQLLQYLRGSEQPIPPELLKVPLYNLINLMTRAHRTAKLADYRRALRYAQKKEILGIFHRWIVFFPAPVLDLLRKGMRTELPEKILQFPLFDEAIPVYHVKLLGKTIIEKDQNTLRVKLSTLEKAFVIHLALRAEAPGKSITVNALFENFWEESSHPSSRLSHFLVQLKKKLMMPTHLLRISSTSGQQRLVNRGCHFTTDYSEFETFLTQAKTLERAHEWKYALSDYTRAFTMLRGEPFIKMYDQWSEQMRQVIQNRVEETALHHASVCAEHDSKDNAKKILEKAIAIVPSSIELRRYAETL
jgi:tetratricopeptide (TPR) repeat protein/transposase-like protein